MHVVRPLNSRLGVSQLGPCRMLMADDAMKRREGEPTRSGRPGSQGAAARGLFTRIDSPYWNRPNSAYESLKVDLISPLAPSLFRS